MKDITLKEFIEIAKDNEELKNRVAECVKVSNGGKVSDGLANIAAGAGYQLTDCNLPMSRMLEKGRILTDTEMGIINGGTSGEPKDDSPSDEPVVEKTTVDPVIDKHSVCAEIYKIFGFDPTQCY